MDCINQGLLCQAEVTRATAKSGLFVHLSKENSKTDYVVMFLIFTETNNVFA